MKKLISSIFVIFLLFTNQAFSEQKIAFIDMDKVISTSKSGSSILKQLTDINKKNLKFLIILFILLNHVNFVYAEVNIVFVDLNKIMTTSKPGSSILENLKKKNNQLLNNFKKDGKKLKDDEIKLISQKNILSEEEFQSKVKKLKIEINTYNENRKKTIKDFNILKAETTDKFMKMINSIFIKYSNDKSISMIFDKKNMIIGKSELDITDEIIKIVNNEIKEFKFK